MKSVSPSKEIQFERIKTLYYLNSTNKKKIVLTTINAVLQKTLYKDFLIKKTNQLNKNGIKFKMIGTKKMLSKKLIEILLNSEKVTKNNKTLQINLALNYGSKSELINSINLIKKKKIKFTEFNINKYLYTNSIPDPDLLIRTGNTNRLSNFMLWQLAYSEIYFEKKLWPDFTIKDYNKILNKFKRTKRNFGKI